MLGVEGSRSGVAGERCVGSMWLCLYERVDDEDFRLC